MNGRYLILNIGLLLILLSCETKKIDIDYNMFYLKTEIQNPDLKKIIDDYIFQIKSKTKKRIIFQIITESYDCDGMGITLSVVSDSSDLYIRRPMGYFTVNDEFFFVYSSLTCLFDSVVPLYENEKIKEVINSFSSISIWDYPVWNIKYKDNGEIQVNKYGKSPFRPCNPPQIP
jgi:hypothetical protein